MSTIPKYELILSNLISLQTFQDEVGMQQHEFMRYRKAGRVEGLITIDLHTFVDRSQISIKGDRNGRKFALWVKLGGRSAPVSVPEELKRLRSLKEAGISSLASPDLSKQPNNGDK